MDVIVKEGRAHMWDETGSPVSIDEAELEQAVAAGFRPQTREEYESRVIQRERSTPGQMALTAAEGALRGGTFGLGTAAAAALGGEEYREAASERAAVNPRLSVAGEIGGAIAPALLSGGAGAVGTAARMTPAGLAARAGHAVERGAGALARGAGLGRPGAGLLSRGAAEAVKLGAAGAVEGAAYGLGSSLADAALEGTEWTAERAIAGLEHGIIHGGVGGAAIGAGGAVIGRAGRAVLDRMAGEGKTFRKAVQDWADRRTVKAVIGNDIQTFRKLTNNGEDLQRLERVAEKLRTRGVVGQTDEDMLNAINREADSATARLADVATDLDNAGVRPSAARLFDEVDEQVKRLREVGTADHARVANQVERQVERLRATMRVARPDGSVERVLRDPTFTELRKFKTGLGEATQWHKASQSMATTEMQKVYGSVARRLDEAADEVGGEAARLWREANEDASDFLTLKKGLETEVQRKLKNRYISPSDYGTGLTGALATLVTGAGAPAAVLAGLATSVAHKFVRERGSAALGRVADWVAGVEFRMARSAERMAGTRTAAGTAGAIVKRSRGGLERIKATAERGAVPTAEARDAPERVRARERLGRSVLRGALPVLLDGSRAERYDAAAEGIREVQRDPSALLARIERVTAPIAAEQPEVASAISRRIVGDYLWLESKLPANEAGGFGETIGPPKPPLISSAEQRKLVSYVEALADPVSVFEELAEGRPNFDALDAIKARRPELFASMATRVALEVSSAEKPLPHGQRVMLSLAFDLPLDAALAPGAVTPTEPEAATPGSPSKLDPQTASESMATPAQEATAA